MSEKMAYIIMVAAFLMSAALGYSTGHRRGMKYEREYRMNSMQWKTNSASIQQNCEVWMNGFVLGVRIGMNAKGK